MNNRYKTAFLALFIYILAAPLGFAQHKAKVLDSNNREIKNLAKEITDEGWIRFKDHLNLKHDELFPKYKAAFGLSADDQLLMKKNEKDDLNATHYTYIQYYKGVEVEGGEYTLHTQGEKLTMAHGKLAEGLNGPGKAAISEQAALAKALGTVGAKKYVWQDPLAEQQLRRDAKDSSATAYPKGKLLYARTTSSGDFDKKHFRMAYRFEIHALEPQIDRAVYVDALTGEVFKHYSLHHEADNTFNSLYNGVRTMTTKYRGWPYTDYVLNDKSRGLIETKYYSSGSMDFWGTTKEVNNQSSNWGWNNTNATSAHWAAGVSYDYFRNTFARSGMNGGNKEIRVHANAPGNASYRYKDNSDNIWVGTLNGNSAATLDVIGHEYTHGVTRYASGLVYEGQAGALNESFSDIFGVMVERSVTGTADWLMGEDALAIRSLENPESFGHPATFGGAFWVNTDGCAPTDMNDWCGVHTNSGVQNHWFFLLAAGGWRNGVNVQGIGIIDAARIAYRNLDVYMQQWSQYADARNGAIAAARDLFGECSNQHLQTINAWAAVGIGAPATACVPPVSIYISGPSYLNQYESGTWTAYASGGDGVNYTYNWFLDTGSGYNFAGSGQSFNYYRTPSSTYTLLVEVSSGGRTSQTFYNVYCNDCYMMASTMTANVYPNPATGSSFEVSVHQPDLQQSPIGGLSQTEGVEYVLFNSQGDPVHRGKSGQLQFRIPTAALRQGFYYLRIYSKAGVVTKHVRIDR